MARKEKIKVITYGLGAMGRLTAKLMLEKGMEIVAATDKFSHIGEDLGDVLELGYKMGVTVNGSPEEVLSNTKADIVAVCAKSLLKDMKPIFIDIMNHGFNVVSLAEETFYCKRSNPEDTAELDACAKKNGVTLTSVGIQDVVWLNLFTTISAACHKMDKVIGRAVADQNIYGEEATKGIGFGLTEEQFRNRTDAGDIDPDWFGRTLEAIISKLGMTPTKYSSFLEPVLAEHDTHYDGGNRDIKAGLVRGWNQISEIETAEGTVFRSEFISKICDPDEPEYHGFEIQGQPNLTVMIPGLEPPYIICSSMVNRVPDVINAKPGFISLDEMPTPQYRPGSYEKYID